MKSESHQNQNFTKLLRMKDTQPPLKLPEQEYEAEIFFAVVYHPWKKKKKQAKLLR